MKKLYLKFNSVDYNQIIKASSEENSNLNLLMMAFNPIHDWISVTEKNEQIYIWNDFLEEQYDSWQDIPKLELSKENYTNVIEVWNQNINSPTQYLVLSQDNAGLVVLEPKNQLSAEDLDWIEQEKVK